VVASINEAAAAGARLVSFPEASIPGYPEWIWRLRPGADSHLSSELHAKLLTQAVDLTGNDLAPVLAAARRQQVTVVLGLHEIDGTFSRSTLYNTVVVVGPQGELINRHRKLMPTNPERGTVSIGEP
jgi:nitrilase